MWSDWEICWPSFSLEGKNVVFICSVMILETYHIWTYLEERLGREELIGYPPFLNYLIQCKISVY
jgi:hypothetical protein